MSESDSETISLHTAVLNNDFETVQLLIEKGADFNSPNSQGLKPLHLAIMTNNARITGELLTHGKEIKLDMYVYQLAITLNNTVIWNLLKEHYDRFLYWKTFHEMKNAQGETLVHYSVRYRSIKMLNEFIEYQLNINVADVQGFTPLHLAVINDDTKFVEHLLKSGADLCAKTLDGRSSIHFAVQYQCFETLSMLVNSEVDVNEPITSSGLCPLHIAVENNDERTVNLLITAGGDIHCKAKDGKSLVHVAVENEHPDMINMLLEKGVDVNARFGELEQSAIELALISKNPKIISAILNYDPDINSKNKDGLNALFIALKNQCFIAVTEMFSLKPDFSVLTNDNVSLFHYALVYENDYVVNYFLKNNINISTIDNEGKNVLHYAAEYGDRKTVSRLINKGLDVNSRTTRNVTPLHLAVERNVVTAETLLRCGADVNAEDANGQTPLFYSLRSQEIPYVISYSREVLYKEVLNLLLVRGANVNHFDNTGNTAVYYLMSNLYLADSENLVLSFIRLGANINSTNLCNDNILHISLKYGCVTKNIITLFLYNGGNINQLNKDNQTPLEVYLESGKVRSDILESLINKGAKMTKNKMGENALHLVVKTRAEKALEVLLERKFADLNDKAVDDGSTVLHYAIKHAPSWYDNDKNIKWSDSILNTLLLYKDEIDLNATDKEGKTPLHLAVIKDSMYCVETLLSNDVDVNIKDVFGNSPLYYAISNKNLSMINLLLQKGASV